VVGAVLAFVAPMSAAYAVWSRTATASLGVTVAAAPVGPPPAAPALTCQSRDGSAVSFTWPVVAGLTYTVHQASTNADASFGSGTAPTGSGVHTLTPAANAPAIFYRVKASDGTSTSGWSNTVSVVRSGNGANTVACTQVTP
jgi:hypothetical protein